MDKKSDMMILTKDPQWQKIRISLLGNWSEKPEWCCSTLRKYLGNISTSHSKKLLIVMNYLTGTGFRTGTIKHECISNLREQISKELKLRKEELKKKGNQNE